MSPAKINELFDTLRAACARQFGFNPRQLTAGMRYVGPEGHGRDVVHVFRDAGTHSQITLKNTFASLRATAGEKPHWSEAEQARYRQTDAEIEAAIEARRVELDFIRHSALYQDHREQLLSHYKAWPGYREGEPNPREAARTLIVALADARDPRLAAFAEQLHTQDPDELAHLLLAPCHLELEESRLAANLAAG
ncbi:MAG TPA: hypothetical protein PK201_11810 [Accumulibacter sp.]|nr:hypothetical protein [Accumulibacter sp.]